MKDFSEDILCNIVSFLEYTPHVSRFISTSKKLNEISPILYGSAYHISPHGLSFEQHLITTSICIAFDGKGYKISGDDFGRTISQYKNGKLNGWSVTRATSFDRKRSIYYKDNIGMYMIQFYKSGPAAVYSLAEGIKKSIGNLDILKEESPFDEAEIELEDDMDGFSEEIYNSFNYIFYEENIDLSLNNGIPVETIYLKDDEMIGLASFDNLDDTDYDTDLTDDYGINEQSIYDQYDHDYDSNYERYDEDDED